MTVSITPIITLRETPVLLFLTLFYLCFSVNLNGQNGVSETWVSDLGNGKYKNPILHADYSDPDVVKVGKDFYMTSSSFNAVPGLPILHSTDLVNWKIIGHALQRIVPEDHFARPQHGNGVWAPSIRYHQGHFYIYWGDPDFGIYMVKSKNPAGPWEKPVLVQEGKGLIDPSPLWDDDGNAYLVHAYAGSRAGIKSILVINRMSPDGKKLLDNGSIIFDGHEEHPTIEGPKFYKKDSYYYVLAPAGGVSTGWQLALRSKNPLGPYEEKIILHQGNTEINGPHQGGLIDLESGESWFIHFQDKEAYGRVVHLQPVRWEDGWPLMGIDINSDRIGEPVRVHRKPKTELDSEIITPPESDEFISRELGLQWQWHANPEPTWAFQYGKKGVLRLYAHPTSEKDNNLWNVPNLLLQKFPAPAFTVTTKLEFNPNEDLINERTGLLIMGEDYAYIGLVTRDDGIYLAIGSLKDARKGGEEEIKIIEKITKPVVFLRVVVKEGGQFSFSYSYKDGSYNKIKEEYTARAGRWIGAKVGIFATGNTRINDTGYADYDWFRVKP